jgi:hypothetical protein
MARKREASSKGRLLSGAAVPRTKTVLRLGKEPLNQKCMLLISVNGGHEGD